MKCTNDEKIIAQLRTSNWSPLENLTWTVADNLCDGFHAKAVPGRLIEFHLLGFIVTRCWREVPNPTNITVMQAHANMYARLITGRFVRHLLNGLDSERVLGSRFGSNLVRRICARGFF